MQNLTLLLKITSQMTKQLPKHANTKIVQPPVTIKYLYRPNIKGSKKNSFKK